MSRLEALWSKPQSCNSRVSEPLHLSEIHTAMDQTNCLLPCNIEEPVSSAKESVQGEAAEMTNSTRNDAQVPLRQPFQFLNNDHADWSDQMSDDQRYDLIQRGPIHVENEFSYDTKKRRFQKSITTE